MAEKEAKELTPEELEEEDGEPLPERQAMSLITPPIGADGIGTVAPLEPPSET